VKRIITTFALCVLAASLSVAQLAPAPTTSAQDRLAAFEQRQQLKSGSIINNIPFESVGPTVMSGRIADVAVYEADPSHFYVAFASGGLWKTENNGTSFTPLFDKEAVMTIGDIAVNWQDSTIWVGTGEVNSSRSSYAGVGLYKSTNGGKDWQHLGLGESHHIGRIVLHPTDANTAWVAVLGHLYSPNNERGIYKTSNGGATWQQTLFVNENSGAIDLIVDESAPNTLYAATWHRERRAWNFVESGTGSGIHKSTDGGETWTLLTTPESGFPTGEGVGRIGIDLYKKGNQTVLYSLLDNYDRRPEEEKSDKETALTKDALRTMDKRTFLNLDTKKIKSYLKKNNFPEKYTAEKVVKMVKSDDIAPLDLVEYLEDANSLLFDTPVIGAEVYRSDDGGKSWTKTHEDYLDFVYNSYGYYFGQIRVSPHDADKIYFAGVPVVRSDDGGKTFENINGDNVHVDHHALWLNPKRDKHLILGNDGGLNISYDDGATWTKCNIPAVGQFYAIAVDNAEPYNIYGGLQDNGVWVGPSTYDSEKNRSWHNTGHYPYKGILGGDGMQVAIDSRDNNTVYTGLQFGWYYRINKTTGERELIKPQHALGENPLRFNWQTPIHLSVHNQDILYLGSNKVHRSMNQGNDWAAISDDLTKGGIKGDVAFGTITALDESPFQFGLLYAGTDDGNVRVSKDGGTTWQSINKGLPDNLWVTEIYASRHDKATVYCALNGYRWDNFKAYCYKSTDYGSTWTAIGKDLPDEPVNVLKDDPKNPSILYVGTDHGLYVSLDKGTSFMLMDKDLPAVAVHDVVVQATAQDLLVGTHGRSIYKANIQTLQALNDDIRAKPIHLFALKKAKSSSNLGKKPTIWTKSFEQTVEIPFYSNSTTKATVSIQTESGISLASFDVDADKGLNFAEYDFKVNEKAVKKYERWLNKNKEKDANDISLEKADDGAFYLRAGAYVVVVKSGTGKDSGEWVVE